jgi:hypothetical protein
MPNILTHCISMTFKYDSDFKLPEIFENEEEAFFFEDSYFIVLRVNRYCVSEYDDEVRSILY